MSDRAYSQQQSSGNYSQYINGGGSSKTENNSGFGGGNQGGYGSGNQGGYGGNQGGYGGGNQGGYGSGNQGGYGSGNQGGYGGNQGGQGGQGGYGGGQGGYGGGQGGYGGGQGGFGGGFGGGYGRPPFGGGFGRPPFGGGMFGYFPQNPYSYVPPQYNYGGDYNRLQNFMMPQGMSPEVTQKMQKASDEFRKCDTDNSGSLDKTEWRKVLKNLNCNIPEQDLDGLFDRIDKDKSGKISEREFCEWYSACY